MATGSSRWRDYWVLRGGVTEQSCLSSGQATFHSLLPLLCGDGDTGTLKHWLLRPGWSPPTTKAKGGWRALDRKLPSEGSTHATCYTANSVWALPSSKPPGLSPDNLPVFSTSLITQSLFPLFIVTLNTDLLVEKFPLSPKLVLSISYMQSMSSTISNRT